MAQSCSRMFGTLLQISETSTYYLQDQERVAIENNLEAWCERLLELNFEVRSTNMFGYRLLTGILGSNNSEESSPASCCFFNNCS